MSDLIGTVRHMSDTYYVYRAPGKPGDAEPFYFGMSKGLQDTPPYCDASSLGSLYRRHGLYRVELKPA